MKTGKEFYQAGDAAIDKQDWQGAVKNFKQGAEMGHQGSAKMLFSIYGSGVYNISPKEILGELEHFSGKENIYAMLYLGRIRIGNLQRSMIPLFRDNHAAFASAVSQNDYDSIALVERAAIKAKELYEDKGIDTFDVLGIDCEIFADAYNKAEIKLRGKIKDAMNAPSYPEFTDWLKVNYPNASYFGDLEDAAADYIHKAVRFNEMAIEWAKKYLPQTKDLLEAFEEMAVPLRGKASTYMNSEV